MAAEERAVMATGMNDTEFTELVRQYTKLIFTVCYRLTGDYQEAENLTQDTFLTAYSAIGRFEGNHYKPWLIRIAANKSKDYLKSAAHNLTEPLDREVLDTLPDSSTPQQVLEEKETQASLRFACEQLREPYRQVASLRYLEGIPYEDIAKRLDRPLKTVQTQGLRARAQLRKLLGKEVL